MKRLLVAVLLGVFLLAPALVEARTVLYVTQDNCAGQGCDCLSTEDRLFCSEMEELGYDVIINMEGDVKDESEVWTDDVEKADLVFLGEVSESMIDKTQNQAVFCNNVKKTGKKVFATFNNAYKNRSLEGCAFPLALASYPSDDNVCNTNNLWITDTGYITQGFEFNEVKEIYTTPQDIKINFGKTWASAHCDPPGDPVGTGLYSAIATSDRGTFWGLDVPSKFDETTGTGWLLFDRTVLFTTGDHEWNITYFTIPERVTKDKAFMLFANIRSLAAPITEASVEASLNEASLGELSYNNKTGYWENRALSISTSGDLTITADDSSLKEPIKAGSFEVRIVSGSYAPGETYSARAKVLFQDEPKPAEVKYRIWDSNLSVIEEGDMIYLGGTYVTDLVFEDQGELIFEVTAKNSSLVGGAFKKIRPGNASEVSFVVEPAEWVVTATETGLDTMTFTIEAREDLTGLRVDKTGELADNIVLNTNDMATSLSTGDSTKFSATLDWSGFSEGEKTGELFVDSDQFSATVPIRFIFIQVTGDWLEAEPGVLDVVAEKGRTTTKTIELTNTANHPTTGLKLTASGELAGIVSFTKEPYYLNASESREVELVFDATGLEVGTYTGAITITSSLGLDEIELVDLEVTPDVSDLLSDLKTEWKGAVANLTDNGRVALSEDAADLSGTINSTIAEAEAALAEDDHSTAVTLYRNAREDLDTLKQFERPGGLDWPVVIIVIVVLGLLGYLGWRFLKARKKKPKKQKKAELPKAEEEYRVEYY